MAPVVTLYAWAAPIVEELADHTWVTTYDNRRTQYPDDAAVAKAGESYWYCWGSFQPKGGTPDIPGGFLGEQSGDLGVARCLVKPNADSRTDAAARGTIFVYGVSGVCHQLANQVLYATRAGGRTPLTVKNAGKTGGYWFSTFIYGTYGVDTVAWTNKLGSCGALSSEEIASGAMTLPGLPDDFETRAREVLGDDPKLAELLALRAEINRFVAQKQPGLTPPSAATLNARNRDLLSQARKLLDDDRKFTAIFGFAPGQEVDLVDPRMQQGQR